MKKVISLILSLLLVATCVCALVACNADPDKIYDKVTKTLHLSKDYEGKDFLSDGIGKATLNRPTDGDTSSFRLASGTVISVRYYNIDTPESTGGVEKWGKSASNFTKKILQGAKEIVLEATADTAKNDAYGTRYLGYVWYRNSESDSFKCLNLQIVENGYSRNTGTNTSDFPYYSYFAKAEDAASRNALHIWSNDDDALFNDAPTDMSIKEFYEKINDPENVENGGYNAELYNKEMDSGLKIRFDAYMSDLTVSDNGSGTYTFTGTQYDPDTDKYYNIDVYCMYNSQSQSKLKLGHLYTVIGSVALHNGNWQISGINYNDMGLTLKDATVVKQEGYYLTFDSNAKWFSNKNASVNVYGNVTVTEILSTDGGNIVFKGTAKQLTGNNTFADRAAEFTFTVPATHSGASKIVKGASLTLHGFQFEPKSGNITIPASQAIN